MFRKIRIIEIGPRSSELVNNLVISLNQIQKSFEFIHTHQTIKLDSDKAINGVFDEEYVWGCVEKHLIKLKVKNEYPIAICDIPLPDETFSSSEERGAIISTYGIDKVLKREFDLDKFLKYTIGAIIIDQKNEYGDIHKNKTLGCPNDYCDLLSEINIGMEKGEYCKSCRRELYEAVERGALRLTDLAATSRILDQVSGRKVCFVMIPFRKKFDSVYEAIKLTMKERGYMCVRADEIFETRTIMNIINELVERADIIIADLTDRNPNVFYEVGYAHAKGKGTILLTQNATDVPFDLRHKQYIKYTPGKTMRKTIREKLNQYLRK